MFEESEAQVKMSGIKSCFGAVLSNLVQCQFWRTFSIHAFYLDGSQAL
jgi:hypothetical protein